MSTQNKEEIYDNEISPLMRQIIAICQREGIEMFSTSWISPRNPKRPFDKECLNLTDTHEDGTETLIAII